MVESTSQEEDAQEAAGYAEAMKMLSPREIEVLELIEKSVTMSDRP